MKLLNRYINNENGVSSIEACLLLPVIFFIIAMIYEVLKFQNDIAVIYINEEVATNHVDLSFLDKKVDAMTVDYLYFLNKYGNEFYFNSLSYSDVAIRCYKHINLTLVAPCDKNAKLISITYKVKREFTNDYISDFLSLPQQFDREVFVINDYYG